ncbi:MAG: hypothetical protein R6U51_01950 [Anaerolineales bacterium]
MKKWTFLSVCVFLAISLSGCEEGGEAVDILPRENVIPADAVKVLPETDIYPPKLHAAGWEEPTPLSAPINTAGAEVSPFITPDGQTLYFFFTPDPQILVQDQLSDGATGIYVSQKPTVVGRTRSGLSSRVRIGWPWMAATLCRGM